MVCVTTALRCHANIRDARVLCVEAVRQNRYFADSFERRLSADRLSETRAGRSLSVEREVGAPALSSNELESIVGVVGDVGRQIEEVVNVAAVAGKINNLLGGERVRDGLIFGLDQACLRFYRYGFGGGFRSEFHVDSLDLTTDQVHVHDLGDVEAF